jgi:hypothetical protein
VNSSFQLELFALTLAQIRIALKPNLRRMADQQNLEGNTHRSYSNTVSVPRSSGFSPDLNPINPLISRAGRKHSARDCRTAAVDARVDLALE